MRSLQFDKTALENVWDFFETLGLLTRRGVLDEEMVWSTFYHWINGYWQVSQKLIEERRKTDPSLWTDFYYIYQKVNEIERAKNPTVNHVLAEPAIKEFLEQEVQWTAAQANRDWVRLS